MIKSILLPVMGGVISESGLATACEMARLHDAHVVAVICISDAAGPMAWWLTLSATVAPQPYRVRSVRATACHRGHGGRRRP